LFENQRELKTEMNRGQGKKQREMTGGKNTEERTKGTF